MRLLLQVLAITVLLPLFARAQSELPRIEPARVKEIAGWLTAKPSGHFTPSFDDRAFWTDWKNQPAGRAFIDQAAKFATQPTPVLTEELYAQFAKTGQRAAYEKLFGDRAARLRAFTFAEGFNNDGKYLPLIETELSAILDEPSWAVPAHAYGRKTWKDNYDNIDLAAAARAWDLATTDYLLGTRLKPESRERIRKEVRARVFTPYLERVRAADRKGFWWMNGSNNWNGVCNSGVVGAALLLCESPVERAEFIAAVEAYSPFFIAGFTDDGLCQEGLGYWVYGFGHHVLGAEAIRQATKGKVDLLAGEKVKRIAAFDIRWDVVNGIFPAYGDAWIKTKTASWLHDFAVLRFGVGELQGVDDPLQLHVLGAFTYRTLFDFSLPRKTVHAGKPLAAPPLRDWFPDGGALIARRADSTTGLTASFKGGNNDQPHNHNDLGSYVIIKDGTLVLTDLGADAYVKDTFGPKRYTSGVMNSFGHPVPRVGGRLQLTGAKAKAVTLRTELTAERDLWEQDLTSAYDTPGLRKLTRTFIFTRTGPGKVEIIDHATFDEPQAFGTAVILRNEQKREAISPGSFRVSTGVKSVDVTFSADNNHALIATEEPIIGIVPSMGPRGKRIGIDLTVPAKEVTLHVIITPSADPVSDK